MRQDRIRSVRTRPRRYPFGISAGSAFSPASLNPALWLDASNAATLLTDGAASFASASSQSLSCASNSSLQGGATNWWTCGWVNVTTIAGGGGTPSKLWGKGTTAFIPTTAEWVVWHNTTFDQRFKVSTGDGTNAVTLTLGPGGTFSLGTWYFIFTWYDVATAKLYAFLNNANLVSASVPGTPNSSTNAFEMSNASYVYNGLEDSVVWGKCPTALGDGTGGSLALAISTALYNGGNGVRASDISSANRTAWGVVSGWDFAQPGSGLVADSIGTNTLTNNNAVTFAAGIVSGVANADGDPVATWLDLSGNGRNVTQATAGSRPLLKTGVNGKNGLPIVKFDGTDDFLSRVASGLPIQTSPRWIFMVAQWKAYTGSGMALTWAAGADYAAGMATNGSLQFYAQAYYTATGPQVLINNWYCVGSSYDGTAVSLYRNGTASPNSPITVTAPTATPEGVLRVGSLNGSSVANIEIGELIIGSGTLSAANVTSLTNYANAKWGVF